MKKFLLLLLLLLLLLSSCHQQTGYGPELVRARWPSSLHTFLAGLIHFSGLLAARQTQSEQHQREFVRVSRQRLAWPPYI